MLTPRKKIEDWIRKQLYIDSDLGNPTKFVLKHIAQGAKAGPEISSIAIPEHNEDKNDEFINKVITDLVCDAETDAADSPENGEQHYVIHSFFEKQKTRPAARCSIRVESGDSEEETGFAVSKQGLLGQLMKHNEVLTKQNVGGMSVILTSLTRALEASSQSNDKLSNEKFKTIELMENLLSQQHNRDLENTKAENREKMMMELLDTVKLIAPKVVSSAMGRPALPEHSNTELKSLLESFTPDQLQSLGGVLTSAQLIALAEIAESNGVKSH